MRTIKLTLQYDGTEFVGWQRQEQGESIQGTIEDALARIEGQAVTVHGAGRTDAGVHAVGQVASVRVSSSLGDETIPQSLAPQHHSPAGFLYEPRLIHVSCASAAVVTTIGTKTRSARNGVRNIGGLLGCPM